MPTVKFTRENAREMSRRGNLARWSRPPTLTITPATPEISPQPVPDSPDVFLSARLVRVRKQLSLVDSALEEEAAKGSKCDGQRVDRLAAASMRLSDQEFALSNRPKPGNRRPGTERGPKSQSGAFWGSNPAQQTASPPAQAQPEVPTPEEPSQDSP